MAEEIINRIAQSNLMVFDLEELWPVGGLQVFALSPLATDGLFREKAVRQSLDDMDLSAYAGQVVCVEGAQDYIVPQWLWPMLSHALAHAKFIGEGADVMSQYYTHALQAMELSPYQDKKVLLKGCAAVAVPPSAYLQAAAQLEGVASKLMYGEACSNVPIFKALAKGK